MARRRLEDIFPYPPARSQTREDDLRYKFDRYGKLLDVYIPRDPSSNKPRGFGFVTFVDRRDAEDAVDALDGFVTLLAFTNRSAHKHDADAILTAAPLP